MAILEIENLSKLYKKKELEIPALKDITFNVEKGEFISVVGRSGSGKSTLLNLIGGIDTATEGKISFNGKKLHEMNRKELELHRRHSVGMIFQSFNLIPHRTAADNVNLALVFGNIPKGKRKARTNALLEQVGLSGRASHVPAELSGGEAQRVAIARALANNPQMLLADEPTGNLDSKTAEEIVKLLTDLCKDQNITILMITHEQEIARKVSDRIITLLDGEAVKIEDNPFKNQNGGS